MGEGFCGWKSGHKTSFDNPTAAYHVRRVKSTPDPNTFEKYRDTPPISMAYFCKSMPSSWQKVVYTPPICITIRLPFVSRYCCRSIRVRGRWDTPNYGSSFFFLWFFWGGGGGAYFCLLGHTLWCGFRMTLTYVEGSQGHTRKGHIGKNTLKTPGDSLKIP